MDWLRRNWPDLIIGVALIAVVALIVVTLLSGGSLASLVRRDSPPAITDTTPGTAENTTATESATGNDTQTAANGTSGTPAAGDTDPDDTGVDVFVPGVPGGQAGTASSASGGQTQASAAPGGTQSSGGVAQSGAQEGQANASGPLPEATQDGGFRVAAGAVDSRDAAASLAETFRDADYTVTVEQQGGLYLLWVGPYATRPGADQVAARLQTDGLVPDALVYSYDGSDSNANNGNADSSTNRGDNNTGPGSNSGGNAAASDEETGANTNTAAGSADAAANTGAASAGNAAGNSAVNAGVTAATSTGNAAGQRYLQVGAFATDESAQPLREQLETLGFNVSRRQSGTGLVRLLVGPLGDAQIAQTQARLNGAGITDAFPVAP